MPVMSNVAQSDDVAAYYLTTDDVAARFGISRRTVRELTRNRAIPHRVLPYGRRCLFDPLHLQAWEDGASLATVELPHGGRIVKPRR